MNEPIMMVSIPLVEYNRLKTIEAKQGESFKVGIGYIAERLGVCKSAVIMSPWHMPNFGEGFQRNVRKEWLQKDVDEWLAIPVKERRRMYKERDGKLAA